MRVHICSLMFPLIEARVLYLCLCLIMTEGSHALQQNTSWGGWLCVQLVFFFFFFFEVDGQTLIKGVFLFYF